MSKLRQIVQASAVFEVARPIRLRHSEEFRVSLLPAQVEEEAPLAATHPGHAQGQNGRRRIGEEFFENFLEEFLIVLL